MKRLRSLLLGAMLAASALFASNATSPPPVAASTLCDGSYYALVLFQNASYGGQCLGFGWTGGGTPQFNVNNDLNGTSGPCWHPGFPASWSWGDCVSSLKWSYNSCHWHFGLYQDVNYGGTTLYSYDGGPNVFIASMPTGKNDQASSVKVYYTSSCPLAPAP